MIIIGKLRDLVLNNKQFKLIIMDLH